MAVSHVVSNLIKKTPLRLSSCWTPVSGSFESIVEEDEELNDEEELETSTADTVDLDKTGWWFYVLSLKSSEMKKYASLPTIFKFKYSFLLALGDFCLLC